MLFVGNRSAPISIILSRWANRSLHFQNTREMRLLFLSISNSSTFNFDIYHRTSTRARFNNDIPNGIGKEH